MLFLLTHPYEEKLKNKVNFDPPKKKERYSVINSRPRSKKGSLVLQPTALWHTISCSSTLMYATFFQTFKNVPPTIILCSHQQKNVFHIDFINLPWIQICYEPLYIILIIFLALLSFRKTVSVKSEFNLNSTQVEKGLPLSWVLPISGIELLT